MFLSNCRTQVTLRFRRHTIKWITLFKWMIGTNWRLQKGQKDSDQKESWRAFNQKVCTTIQKAIDSYCIVYIIKNIIRNTRIHINSNWLLSRLEQMRYIDENIYNSECVRVSDLKTHAAHTEQCRWRSYATYSEFRAPVLGFRVGLQG